MGKDCQNSCSGTGNVCLRHNCGRRKLLKRVFIGILVLASTVLVTSLTIRAILYPNKPKFILQDATVYAFNISSPNLLTSTFQVTLASRNPNNKIGIYYDKLDVYATYRSQQITLRTSIQPNYQGHKDCNVWSPYLYGNAVPVAPYNAVALCQDQAAGNVLVIIKVAGRVRFKYGSFSSGTYHLSVNCRANIQFGSGSAGIVVGDNAVKYQLFQSCSVSV